MSSCLLLLGFIQLIYFDCLDRAGGRGSHDSQALRFVGVGIVHNSLFPAQVEYIRREWDALRVSQTPVQVKYYSHVISPLFFAGLLV
jgi:hypothetical protein